MRLVWAALLLLASCGSSGNVPPGDASVRVWIVETLEPYAASPAIGHALALDGSWEVRVVSGLHPGLTWTVVAHEFLHVLGLSGSHGEPFPCLGSASVPGPFEMVLCEQDARLLASAAARGTRHPVITSDGARDAATMAAAYLNANAGAELFRVEAP